MCAESELKSFWIERDTFVLVFAPFSPCLACTEQLVGQQFLDAVPANHCRPRRCCARLIFSSFFWIRQPSIDYHYASSSAAPPGSVRSPCRRQAVRSHPRFRSCRIRPQAARCIATLQHRWSDWSRSVQAGSGGSGCCPPVRFSAAWLLICCLCEGACLPAQQPQEQINQQSCSSALVLAFFFCCSSTGAGSVLFSKCKAWSCFAFQILVFVSIKLQEVINACHVNFNHVHVIDLVLPTVLH